MPQRDQVYTIADDDVLASMRRDLERQGALRPGPGGTGDQGTRTSSRQRVRYAQPPPSGSRALAASTLSLFLCGAGQAYNGQGKLGALLFLTEALIVSVNWAVITLWSEARGLAALFGMTEWTLFLSIVVADYLLVILALSGAYQAFRQAEQDNGQFGGLDNPIASTLASLLLPGWGQIVNGQPGKGVAFLWGTLTGAGTLALVMKTPFLKLLAESDVSGILNGQISAGVAGVLAVGGILWILSIYDAALVASMRRRMS